MGVSPRLLFSYAINAGGESRHTVRLGAWGLAPTFLFGSFSLPASRASCGGIGWLLIELKTRHRLKTLGLAVAFLRARVCV